MVARPRARVTFPLAAGPALLALAACSGHLPGNDVSVTLPADSGDTAATTDSGDDTGLDTGSCVETPAPPDMRDGGSGARPAARVAGEIHWMLDFDAAAEATGLRDCDYARSYDDFTETTLQGWLCPECEVLAVGTSVMTEGWADCYAQISDAAAERPESLGLGDVDGVRHLWRSGSANIVLGDMGAVVERDDGAVDVTWTDTTDLDGGGSMTLLAEGTLTLDVHPTATVPDPAGVLPGPYACGWPQNSPGGPNASWSVTDGAVFPNLRLEDQCGESFDTWDLRGYYTIIDASAPDCGPCQLMASTAEDFRAEMEAACLPVEMVTLLVAGLGNINNPAPLDVRQDWAAEFGLRSPVLGDLGAGYAILPRYLGRDSGMSFPSVAVLAPDGTVLGGQSGFGDWEAIRGLITGHAAGG